MCFNESADICSVLCYARKTTDNNLRRRRVVRETSETSRNISWCALRSAVAVYVDIMTASNNLVISTLSLIITSRNDCQYPPKII